MSDMSQLPDIHKVLSTADELYSRSQVQSAIEALALRVNSELHSQNPIVLTVMNGGLFFAAQLMQHLPFALQQDYCQVSRYGDEQSGGKLQWMVRPQTELTGRTVLIVDDILDEGVTVEAIAAECIKQGAAAVKIAVLVQKQHNRNLTNLAADYCALLVPDRFVFGCGMDYQGYWRNLPSIYALADSRSNAYPKNAPKETS